MSTAIMHTGAFYDFGDLILKNQTATRTTQMTINTTSSNNTLIGSIINNNNNNSNVNNNDPNPMILQQNINVAAAAVAVAQAKQHQQQQHQQQKLMLHNALTRAASHPPGNVDTLMNSITEILRVSSSVHRKLERTQSEPIPQVNTSRYKTELCRPFEEAGECKYGDKCQFAHGMHELRNLQRHPKYKTELCRTFHSVGFCPYGPRCHFVHNAEEARNHNRNVAAYHARLAAQQQGHQLPLSPALSMSTGSDRASPIGSLSLSPTSSMANFFPEQNSPTMHQGFTYPQSPPASPTENNMSPITTPPPMIEDARLPVFNRLSSTVDAFTNLAI